MVNLYNLLFERATDSVIQGFINYFKSYILPNLTEPKYKNKGYFLLKTKPEFIFKDDKYETYKEVTGDNGIIIRDNSDLEDMLSKFTISVYPKEARSDGALGDMNNNGELRIFLQNWDYRLELDQKKLLEDIKNYLGSKDFLGNLLPHELGHYINALRSANKNKGEPVIYRARTRTRNPALQFQGGTTEYRDSTEEIQASFTAFESYLNNLLDEEKLDGYELALLTSIGIKDQKKFIELAFKSDHFSVRKNQQDKLPPNVYKRIAVRLVQIFNRYKDMDVFNKYKNKDNIDEYEKNNTPPPLP